ncbi:MAG: zinc ribbon domain-containing protein [Myxococcota bacterium]
MTDEHPLLSLQAVDSAADALVAGRAGLPQRAALEACAAEHQKIEADVAAVAAREVELAKTERGLEGEVAESVREGREAEDKLYSGKVQGVSELEGLQTLLDSFRAKQAELEERQLGLMETREELEQALADGAESRAACDAKREELLAALAEGEAAIDAQLAVVAGEREEAVASVPAASLQVYDRLRKSARLSGVVTAQVKGDACGRCRIPVPVMRLTRVREDAAGDVVRCENCNRILLP